MKVASRFEVAELYLPLNCPVLKMRMVDRFYSLPPATVVRDHMENFAVEPYVAERNDCDNRALKLLTHFSGMGLAFAWASIGPHDICTFVDDQKKVWFVEPSNCRIYPPDADLTWMVMP